MKKALMVIVIILLLVGCGVLGYFTYNLNEDSTKYQNEIKDYKTQIQKLQNTTEVEDASTNLVGEFQYIKENSDQPGLTSYIDLMEDGTFYKNDISTAKQWWYGTYTLENDILTLKSSFTVSNDVLSGQNSTEVFTYTVKNNTLNDSKFQLTYTKNEKKTDVQKEFIEMLTNIAKDYAKSVSS